MKKKEMLSIDTLGFDVSYRILSYCWVQVSDLFVCLFVRLDEQLNILGLSIHCL